MSSVTQKGPPGGLWRSWHECEIMSEDLLAVRSQKWMGGLRSNDHRLSDGEGIVVKQGQCALIVEQNRILDLYAEPGSYTYEAGAAPAVMTGPLGEDIRARFVFVGQPSHGGEKQLYYFNIGTQPELAFRTQQPIPYCVTDPDIAMCLDIGLECRGSVRYQIADPLQFFETVCGKADVGFRQENLNDTLAAELVSALQVVLAQQTELPEQLSERHDELEADLIQRLSSSWNDLYGLKPVSLVLEQISATAEDSALIARIRQNAALRDPKAAAEALLRTMKAAMEVPTGEVWRCPNCGAEMNGKFCKDCGTKKPIQSAVWHCSCGAVNRGKFCTNCGARRPELRHRCAACGWEPPEGVQTPKFCPDCGQPFRSESAGGA